MERPHENAIAATIAGRDGYFVGVVDSRLQWETVLPTAELSDFVAAFMTSEALPVITPRGRVHVRSRDWLVWPGDDTTKVRLDLEDAGSW